MSLLGFSSTNTTVSWIVACFFYGLVLVFFQHVEYARIELLLLAGDFNGDICVGVWGTVGSIRPHLYCAVQGHGTF